MFEEWPEVLNKLGTPRRKRWWTELREKGGNAVDKSETEET